MGCGPSQEEILIANQRRLAAKEKAVAKANANTAKLQRDIEEHLSHPGYTVVDIPDRRGFTSIRRWEDDYGHPHRTSGPAHEEFYSSGKRSEATYYIHGKQERTLIGKPSKLRWNTCGEITYAEYKNEHTYAEHVARQQQRRSRDINARAVQRREQQRKDAEDERGLL